MRHWTPSQMNQVDWVSGGNAAYIDWQTHARAAAPLKWLSTWLAEHIMHEWQHHLNCIREWLCRIKWGTTERLCRLHVNYKHKIWTKTLRNTIWWWRQHWYNKSWISDAWRGPDPTISIVCNTTTFFSKRNRFLTASTQAPPTRAVKPFRWHLFPAKSILRYFYSETHKTKTIKTHPNSKKITFPRISKNLNESLAVGFAQEAKEG